GNDEVICVLWTGIKGYFKFQQDSPFSVTDLCSNDNIGGHFNPFGLNITDPNYPQGPGSTHDRYEIGDLGTKHMSLAGLTEFEGVFEDYNLPLYGQNSIVGRSVVIHELNGAREASQEWVQAGRPRHGPVFEQKWVTNARYTVSMWCVL
uniref:Superoxide dismutase copper/zinc binding domain-containing protein n=1 Tax=Periophthalmus magnuspinnatus TaxID=409849 RepID=A0A3B3ZFU2_9GOBI